MVSIHRIFIIIYNHSKNKKPTLSWRENLKERETSPKSKKEKTRKGTKQYA